MTTPELTDRLSLEHMDWLRRQHDRAPNTIASRLRVLRSLGNAGTATREEIAQWWESRTGLAAGTRIVDLSHLREFYKWCELFEFRMDDPSIRLRPPPLENVEYGEGKVSNEQIVDLAERLPPDLRRAVYLGAGAGLRVSESAALDWAEVNSSTDMIRVVRSKGNKTRMVPVSPDLIRLVGEGVDAHVGNVVSGGGEVYSAPQLQRRLNRAMRANGVEFTTHDLRHRFGITAYRSCQDLLAVGEMMGHSSVNTTKLYASADSEVKRKIAVAVMW